MPKKGVERTESETALFAAIFRAVAYREFRGQKLGTDELAQFFLPAHVRFLIKFKAIRKKIIQKNAQMAPGVYQYVLARTAFFDDLFASALNNKIPQIVVLGAGYDTRAYRFGTLNKGSEIIEVDIAPTQNRKKKCLAKAHLKIPQNVTLATMDFNKDSFEAVLGAAGYKNNVETLFVWEGVSYYLDPKSVDATLAFVTNGSHRNSTIAFDYAITLSEENIGRYYGAKEFTRTWRKHRPSELFKFTLEEDQLKAFLNQRGLKNVARIDHKQIEETFLKDVFDLVKITGIFRFAVASPNIV